MHEIHSDSGSIWAIWIIEEEEQILAGALPPADQCPEQITYPAKRLEWLGGRYLLSRLFEEAGLDYQGLSKDEFGKPFPISSSWQISLSNAFPFVAAQIHPTMSVGIDIEIPRSKMVQVIPRILNDSEKQHAGNHLRKLCIYWSAKETMYKIHGKRNLNFSTDILINPFQLGEEGLLTGELHTPGQNFQVKLNFLSKRDFVLTATQSVVPE